MNPSQGSTGPTPNPKSESGNQIDGRERVYQDEEIAITKWMLGKPGEHLYQITALDMAMKRSGNGYLLISPQCLQRLCRALQDMVF